MIATLVRRPLWRGAPWSAIMAAMDADAEWVAAAYRAHADAVYRVARVILGDPDDADDVTQAVFERALLRRATYDPERPLRPWLLGIAARESLGVRRRLRIRRYAPLREDTPARPGPSGEVWTAVSRLPARHRAVVALYYVHGYATEEIAQLLGVPKGTVASRLHYARARLRAALGADAAGEVVPLWD
ncbi:MAG TPA: sigma-70 family RNA polymerase sigma factor [Candidatus Dormibacteraeota bacterium]|jgi:RNA polymerase sigma-70 factor (ECF subfamily)|nr:sigma-70 family RNA polymerase sigma factor [Candidatus Dormibacteraeota bacterium]